MITNRSVAVFSFCLMLGMLPIIAGAQQQQPPKETLRGDGIVTGIANGAIQVELASGKKWIVYLPDSPASIEVEGQAMLSWLKRGMFVSFAGVFDAKGNAQADVNDLMIFQPNKDTKLGAQRDGIAGANKELFGGTKNPDAVPTARYLISARLMNIKDGKMAIAAPGFQTVVPLADKVTIRVKSNDPRLVRLGDKVNVDAWYYTAQAQLMKAKASRLKFIADKPFGYVEKPKPKKPAKKEEAEVKENQETE